MSSIAREAMKLQAILFCVLLSFQPIFCSKILAVFPSGSRSTVLVLQELTKELASRGHEVTFVSFFPLEKPVKNHRDIKIENAHDVSCKNFLLRNKLKWVVNNRICFSSRYKFPQ